MAKTIKLKEGDVKIASKNESFWEEVKESTEADIKRLERLLKLQNGILELCNTKIAEENKPNYV